MPRTTASPIVHVVDSKIDKRAQFLIQGVARCDTVRVNPGRGPYALVHMNVVKMFGARALEQYEREGRRVAQIVDEAHERYARRERKRKRGGGES